MRAEVLTAGMCANQEPSALQESTVASAPRWKHGRPSPSFGVPFCLPEAETRADSQAEAPSRLQGRAGGLCTVYL